MFVSLIYPFQFCPHSCQYTYRATLLCRLLYSRWANLLHSLVRWLTFFSFSPHILHIGDSDAELKKPCSELRFTRAIIFKPPWRTSELGRIKVQHSCRHERHVLVSVRDFRSVFTSTQNINAKKQFKERFQSNWTVSFLSNNRPRPTRICFDLICTTNISPVRSGLAFFHTYLMKTVTGNSTLRAYSPWWKFTKVSGGSAFLCMKSYILEYNNDSKFGLDFQRVLNCTPNEWQRSITYQTVFSHLVRPCLRVREAKKVAFVCVSA